MHNRTALRDLRPTPDTLAGVIAYALEHRMQVTFERPPVKQPFHAPAQVRVETFARLPEIPGEPQRIGNVQAVDWSDVAEFRGDVLRIALVRAIFDLEDDIAARGGTVQTEVPA